MFVMMLMLVSMAVGMSVCLADDEIIKLVDYLLAVKAEIF